MDLVFLKLLMNLLIQLEQILIIGLIIIKNILQNIVELVQYNLHGMIITKHFKAGWRQGYKYVIQILLIKVQSMLR